MTLLQVRGRGLKSHVKQPHLQPKCQRVVGMQKKKIPNLIKGDWLAVSRLLASAQYISSGMDCSGVQELYLRQSFTYASELNDGRGVQDHHKSNGDRW